jgi:pSer/pThr/pTyr-binding forkhead associated (FHA) protein
VDAATRYRQLVQLGREEFLATAAPAALLRHRIDVDAETPNPGAHTLSIDQEIEETLPHGRQSPAAASNLEVYPLTKKPGASFPDRITIGRTDNNDIMIPDHSISRFHAYVRRDGSEWVVADAGSKNGSWLAGSLLAPRKERPLSPRSELRFGDVNLLFYPAADLFKALGGS